MDLSGTIKLINDVQTFDSGFRKRDFVITTKEQYPQDVLFQFVQDRCEILNDYNVGDEVTVFFDIRGREYNGRHFVNLQAWKMEKVAGSQQSAPEPPPFDEAPDDSSLSGGDEEMDDLPF